MRHEIEQPTVVCAWCSTVLERGNEMISHGMCHPCAEDFVSRIAEVSNSAKTPALAGAVA